MVLTLSVRSRAAGEDAGAVRTQGAVPAVYYGPKEQSTPIAVEERALEHVWRAAGQTSVVTLTGLGEDKETLIRDAQVHPVTGKLLHADFYVLEKGKKVRISVPLEFTGVAPAEKAGHIVVKAMHEIEIEVAPAELPHRLAVDLSALQNVGERITAADITLPPSASLITHGDDIVASVTEFVEEKEEVAPAAETVITTAKEAKEGEGEAGAEGSEEKSEQ